MTTFLIVQNIVVGTAVVVSLINVCRRLMPLISQRWQTALADFLSSSSRPTLLRTIGRRLRPIAADGGCGSGCGSCPSGCGPTSPSDEQPLQFQPRARE